MKFRTDKGMQDIEPKQLIIAGSTGPDRSAVDHHIKELADLGETPPSEVPTFYRASAALLTQDKRIQVLGTETSGKVEPMIIRHDDTFWLGLASDHTDRALETHSVAQSKQSCAKPVARELWPLESVIQHIDKLRLQCLIRDRYEVEIYQKGLLSQILSIAGLISRQKFSEGTVMLCGTIPVIGGVRSAKNYSMYLIDTVKDRKLELHYIAESLPIVA